ncbi:DUF4229 domain-containing protein [Actinoplanes teichomyceticus]|uniref:Uncharacterized protein DUF4229 n=1 Tax=Actinoplanes teichomyceticus TaxID=1867 RepID=A0A561WS33_ACTTI|nr:DUF4229 domain-containing protein [Actinoplanes teichomyceticus]TWG26656.1 uncharacterized protein DUF4229 [Actinoplanes teichomyceticus]GIF15057.1 hypothetical protein Ate01nite_50890 [Actinoplanes teichomyceticus]
MSPAVKYTLGRFGLFVVVFAALFPLPLNILVKAMIAFVASAGFAFFLLRRWRDEMAEQLGSVAQRRSAEKARLRSALAGDDAAAAAGDRVVAAEAGDSAAASAATGSADSGSAATGSAATRNADSGSADGGSADSGSADSGSADSGSTATRSTDSGSTATRSAATGEAAAAGDPATEKKSEAGR